MAICPSTWVLCFRPSLAQHSPFWYLWLERPSDAFHYFLLLLPPETKTELGELRHSFLFNHITKMINYETKEFISGFLTESKSFYKRSRKAPERRQNPLVATFFCAPRLPPHTPWCLLLYWNARYMHVMFLCWEIILSQTQWHAL